MAARCLFHRRISLATPSSTATESIYAFKSMVLNRSSNSQAMKEDDEEETQKEVKGKWLTLPPFTSSTMNTATSIARAISGGRFRDSKTEPTSALKWVLHCCPHLPRCLVQKLFRLRQVRRESTSPTSASGLEFQAQEHRPKRVSAKDALNLGDQIFLPITVQEFPCEKYDYCCNTDEISYIHSLELYKDPAIIVVNKPPGMPVQGGIGIRKSLDVLAATYLRYDYSEPPRLVHRLDRDSSGILVMGRTPTSATILHSIFREKTSGASNDDTDNTERILQRRYWALVIGTPKCARGLISAPLTKVVLDNGKSQRITIAGNTKTMASQHAVTGYEVIESSVHGYTWIELSPLTGRKHQLRVHCAEVLGTPIVGDYKYGWHAHKKWNPVPWLKPERESEKHPKWTLPLGLDLKSGSISEKKPRLHLHCRQMVLPNVSLALQHLQSSNHDLSKLESLDLFAPLPFHMRRSWDILSSR